MKRARARAVLGCALGLVISAVGASTAAPPPPLPPFDNLPRHAQPHFNFVVVGVADAERAIAFYTQVLGMRERGRAQPDMQHFEVIVGFDDQPLTPGISLKYRNGPPQPRGNGSSALNLVVTGLQTRVAKVVAMGGRVNVPYARRDTPRLSYGFAVIEDPDGNVIELVEYFRLPHVPSPAPSPAQPR